MYSQNARTVRIEGSPYLMRRKRGGNKLREEKVGKMAVVLVIRMIIKFDGIVIQGGGIVSRTNGDSHLRQRIQSTPVGPAFSQSIQNTPEMRHRGGAHWKAVGMKGGTARGRVAVA